MRWPSWVVCPHGYRGPALPLVLRESDRAWTAPFLHYAPEENCQYNLVAVDEIQVYHGCAMLMEVCDEGGVGRLFGKSLGNKQIHAARSDSRTDIIGPSSLLTVYGTMSPQFSQDDIEEEQNHFSNVVAAFQQYAQYTVTVVFTLDCSHRADCLSASRTVDGQQSS